MLSGSTPRVPSIGHFEAPTIVGNSPALQRVLQVASRLAAGDSKVLITGASGVGKDIIARHVKGSFTGAYRDKVGKLQQSDKGTIFLDEIGEMSLRMQAMLLRFLENGEVVPVGADAPPTRVNVRVISATNRNLQDMVVKGTFREDLLYRINVGQIEVPPLRARRDDIRPLVLHVLGRHARPIAMDAEAMDALERYRWPGNVRELQNGSSRCWRWPT